MSKKEWLKPELINLSVEKTNENEMDYCQFDKEALNKIAHVGCEYYCYKLAHGCGGCKANWCVINNSLVQTIHKCTCGGVNKS